MLAYPKAVKALTLLHGDCLSLIPSIPDGSVSMVFADLPYTHMRGGRVRRCTDNAWDRPIDLAALWAELLRVAKGNAAFVFTGTQPFTTALINSQPKLFQYSLVWEKSRCTGVFLAKRQPLRYHEDVPVFYRKQPIYNAQLEQGKPYKFTRCASKSRTVGSGKQIATAANNDGQRFPKSVLRFASEVGQHPTQKPVALLEWLIRTYSNPGDMILDPTCGSGTTLVACHNTGRRGIGIEKNADYFAVAQRRIGTHLCQPILTP